jgi:hypothetical protein
MSSRFAIVLAGLVLCIAGWVHPAHGQEPSYFTLSGGWAWPGAGPVKDVYESGFTGAASFRTPAAPNYLYGFEVGYSWLTLDTGKLAGEHAGSSFSGGDFGLLSVTTEHDYIIGQRANAARPFVNLGLGYFASFSDDTSVTTGTTSASFATGVYEGSFFGLHGGGGLLIPLARFGLRIDANYQHLFAAGEDLGFWVGRIGIVLYPRKV